VSDRSNLLKLCLRWLIFLLSIVIGGCGIHQGGIPSELHFAPLNAVSQRTAEYRIKPMDQLDIKFFYNPELNETTTVRPDSKIALQLIGDIDAAGRTPSELVAELKERYSTYLQNPAATVIVKGFVAQQAFVDGEVGHPGPVDIMPGQTAWQAIIKAGGFRETATRESVVVVRLREENQTLLYRLDLKSTSLDRPDVAFQLQPYDVVFVPKTWIAEADKFMEQYVERLFLYRGYYMYGIPFNFSTP